MPRLLRCQRVPNNVRSVRAHLQWSSTFVPIMDPRLKQVIEKINAYKKHEFAWKRGEPFPQPYYTWHDGRWQAGNSRPEQEVPASRAADSSFTIMSSNIDFMRSFTRERMEKALAFLEQYIGQISRPSVIMLNEMLVSDLEVIQAQGWVRDGYSLTDVSDEFWESGYYGELR